MRFIIYLIISSIFLNTDLVAQGQTKIFVEWNRSGELPATNGKLLGFAGPVAGISDSVFIAGGGANFPDSMPWVGGKKKYYDDLYVYQKATNDSLILIDSSLLPMPLGYAACISTEKGIVIAGGENLNGVSNKVLLLKWNPKTHQLLIDYLPDLPFPLTGASITSIKDKLYLAGGDKGNEVSDQLLTLNLNEGHPSWEILATIPKRVSNAVMAAQSDGSDECLYIIGGRKKNADRPSDLYSSNLRFDLKTKSWKLMKPLPHKLSAGTGVACGSHSILLFSGDCGETFHKTEKLIFAIAKEKNEKKRDELIREKIKVQASHPGFTHNVLLYDTINNTWSDAGRIPFDAPVTTVAVKWNEEVFIPGGEIRAGVRTPQILSAKIIL